MHVVVNTNEILEKKRNVNVFSKDDKRHFKLKNPQEALFYIDNKKKKLTHLEGLLVRDSEGYKFRVKNYNPFKDGSDDMKNLGDLLDNNNNI